MEKLTMKNTPYHNENPFMKSVVIEMGDNVQITAAGDKSGQMINKNDAVIWKNRVVKDKRKFIKLYHNGIKDFFGLGKAEMDLIRYIMRRVRKDQDKVAFTYKIIKEDTDIETDRTVSKSLAGLILKGIIARAETDGIYYINPNIFFNGDRVAFVRSYVMKKEHSTSESREEREENERVRSGERGNSSVPLIENPQFG